MVNEKLLPANIHFDLTGLRICSCQYRNKSMLSEGMTIISIYVFQRLNYARFLNADLYDFYDFRCS